jgi:hypothetical protein
MKTDAVTAALRTLERNDHAASTFRGFDGEC